MPKARRVEVHKSAVLGKNQRCTEGEPDYSSSKPWVADKKRKRALKLQVDTWASCRDEATSPAKSGPLSMVQNHQQTQTHFAWCWMVYGPLVIVGEASILTRL
jgi:hypothetical protein